MARRKAKAAPGQPSLIPLGPSAPDGTQGAADAAPSRRKSKPTNEGIAARAREHREAWTNAMCEGMAYSAALLQEEFPQAALLLVESGLKRFGERFASEMGARNLDISKWGIRDVG